MVQERLGASERRACRVIDHPRSVQRYRQKDRSEEKALVGRLHELVKEWPRKGYRFMAKLLRGEGSAAVYPVGQRAGVHRQGASEAAGREGLPDGVHRAGLALGERLRGVVQRTGARRAAERGGVPDVPRGAGDRGAVAAALQYRTASGAAGLVDTRRVCCQRDDAQ